jgi:thymidylate synthase (FAD)
MLEHSMASVRFITDRGVTHELVRHRVASFAQESTRYVNYKNKDMEFIKPVWFGENPEADEVFLESCRESEAKYKKLIELGWTPEKARTVLDNSIKTEIVVTANYREWRHIFNLRYKGTTGKPHPQMQGLMTPLFDEFIDKIYGVFDDI